MDNVVEVHNLTRLYGDLVAVGRVNFDVRRGEIFGFLGPNGAGKTTTVRMLTGYLPPSSGTALVNGCDVVTRSIAARQDLGIVPEESNVYVDLTVWQNLMLMGELHGVPRARRTRRALELLELFGLADRAKEKGRALSKGLRKRVMLCMALVNDPALLFLDEPSTGLDIASARLIRELVLRMNRERGTSVFLTTHNMEEADRLCHRIGIIDKGRIAAIDTPQSLRGTVKSRRSVDVTFSGEPPPASDLAGLGPGTEVEPCGNGFRIYGPEPGRIAQEVASRAAAKGTRIQSIRTREPTLEEVFLHITGTKEKPSPPHQVRGRPIPSPPGRGRIINAEEAGNEQNR